MPESSSLSIVLHAHLPYVLGHGRWPHGQDWLHEAAAETYLPLVGIFLRLVSEGISPRVVMGVTPVLAEQLADARFKSGFRVYLDERMDAAREAVSEAAPSGLDAQAELANFWFEFYARQAELFEDLKSDILGALKKLQQAGHIELITSGATHGYAPLLGTDQSVYAQFRLGVDVYRKHFGTAPAGAWLPECAYRPGYTWRRPVEPQTAGYRAGVEEIMAAAGISYFIVDSHLLTGGKPKPASFRFTPEETVLNSPGDPSPFQSYWVRSRRGAKPCAVFVRDPETAEQVWSGTHGYPGDSRYLEFHKRSFPAGLRLWRITGARTDLADKISYDPSAVGDALHLQSDHFVSEAAKRLRAFQKETGVPGTIVAPYDAELFGHWWFEGAEWLYQVLRKLPAAGIQPVMLGETLKSNPPRYEVNLAEGSWGAGGGHSVWLNERTTWIWRKIYQAEERVLALQGRLPGDSQTNGKLTAWMRQAERELLLLQSSDWPFLVTTESARDYAEARAAKHSRDLDRMLDAIERFLDTGRDNVEDRDFADELAVRDHIFRDIDSRLFSRWAPAEPAE